MIPLLFVATPITTDADYELIANMEWCSIWETGIGSGVTTQAEKQQLLWGFSGVLWKEAAVIIEFGVGTGSFSIGGSRGNITVSGSGGSKPIGGNRS